MTPERLARYQRLYASPRYMGAGNLLRRFLDLPADAPIPLSVAHGVDLGHCHRPMDVDSIEPIHWSYNRVLHEEARQVKPSILAPHPWAILAHGKPAVSGRGVIVIGPPPSPENDHRLYDLIKDDLREDWSILVKARGNYRGSLDFWQSKGVKPITAHGPDDTFYERLYGILSSYRTVVGCTFSSALPFAASIGCEVVIVRNYVYDVYEPVRYEEEVNFASPRTRALISCIASDDPAQKTSECRTLLGFDMLDQQERIRNDLREAMRALERPFHKNPHNPLPYKISEVLAMRLGKQGALRYSPRDVLDLVRSQEIIVMRISDIDVWLNGKDGQNYQQLPTSTREKVAIPGCSPRGYSA
jgi:hypothetical protein